jgi:hypothetical protein
MARHIFALFPRLCFFLIIHFVDIGIGISIFKIVFDFRVISRTRGMTKRMLIVPLGFEPA